MNKTTKISLSILLILVLTLNLASAMTVSSVESNNFQPGSEQSIIVKVKNTLDDTTEQVSLSLDLSTLPFVATNSEDDVDEIDEGDSENFDFIIKASNDAKAGNYEIPYTLTYLINNTLKSKKGSFSLTVEGNPELVYSTSLETPVVGQTGKITLKIVNKGFGDAKFVSVTINPNGYTLLSDQENYIGTISSDDFETISLDVIFKSQNPTLNAQIEYKDFDNQLIKKNINLPLEIYSKESAIELGIIQRSYTIYYAFAIIVLFLIWIIRRRIKKKRRLERAQGR
jgi:hypothetical protein